MIDWMNGITCSASARNTIRGSVAGSTVGSSMSARGTRTSRALIAAVKSSCFDGK